MVMNAMVQSRKNITINRHFGKQIRVWRFMTESTRFFLGYKPWDEGIFSHPESDTNYELVIWSAQEVLKRN